MRKQFLYLIFIPLLLLSQQIGSSSYGLTYQYLDLNGETNSFEKFQGQYLLVDAMATWCPPCDLQLVELKNLYPRVNYLIEFFSLSVDYQNDNLTLVRQKAENEGEPWEFGWDEQGEFQAAFNVMYFPRLILFDEDGQFVKSWLGITSEEQLFDDLKIATNGKIKDDNWLSQNFVIVGSISLGITVSIIVVLYNKIIKRN